MGGNANMLVTGFYQDILDFLNSPEYRFREIFPNFPKIENSAEFKMIYTDHKKREPNLMFVSIEVGATGIIHVDGMLYVDDLIKTAEQANNPEQCLKIRHAYTGMLQDRLVNAEVPILVIGTMWSINDHISYLKDNYGNEDWFENISVPCMNEDHTESNFMYDYGQAKTVEHWERLIRDDDEVIAQAKFFCIAIDREGKLFNTDEFTYFNTLPEREPDQIVAAVDVAFGGGDNYAMPIAYVYGRDVYIADVIYSKEETNVTKPRTVDKIIEHNISKVHFEANNGGDEVSIQVSDMCKKRHIVCNITSSRVPTNKTKLDRILAVAQQIRGKDTNEDTYRLIYLARDKQNEEYRRFMSCVSRFSQDLKIQGKQEDDACFDGNTLIATPFGDKKIKDLKVGDKVITPFGIDTIEVAGKTGEKEIIEKFGLKVTPNHKIFDGNAFERADRLTNIPESGKLGYKELIKWKYKKLLYSMEKHTGLWGRESIILANQLHKKAKDTQKGYMLQFGNTTTKKKFQKGIIFIIKMVILLITTSLIWSVYQLSNICRKKGRKIGQNQNYEKKCLINLKKQGKKLKNGIKVKKAENGTDNTQLGAYYLKNQKNEFAPIVATNTTLDTKGQQNIVQKDVITLTSVYNIKTKKYNCYYANGILVSNCDSLANLVSNALGRTYYGKVTSTFSRSDYGF